MKKITDILLDELETGPLPKFVSGMPPVFTLPEMQKLKAAAERPGASKYEVDRYDFVHAFRRNAEPWDLMTKKQREWLLDIKDGKK